jgi:uncharacterized protein YbjT (DUF2867 family)
MIGKKHIVVAGSTGEVGKHLVKLASAKQDLVVHALVRREGSWQETSTVHEIAFDYEDLSAYDALFRDVPCDTLFIALGTTTGKAGAAGLTRVDRDYSLFLINALEKAQPDAHIGFCSSVGADRPRNNYLKAKFAVEQRLQASSLSSAIARPSVLITDRKEFRPVEALTLPLLNVASNILKRFVPHSSFAWKYAPVRADVVAACLLASTLKLHAHQHLVLEGRNLLIAPG